MNQIATTPPRAYIHPDPEVPAPFEAEPRKLLVVDRLGGLSSEVARAAARLDPRPEVLRLRHSTELAGVVAESSPDVLIAGPAEASTAGMKRLAHAHMADPRMVIVLSQNGKPISAEQVAACGASDVIPLPLTHGRMKAKIRRALDLAGQLRAERVVTREVYAPVAAPVPQNPPAPAEVRLGRVFTVASASGGCGKTFYATNFAAYLTRATGARVLLLDLDLQFGEVATTLHLQPERTIAELAEEQDPRAMLGEYVVGHTSGFSVLCAPKDPMAAERIGPREATLILEAARAEFDIVVVDTPPSLNEVVLAALDQSQSLVVMATMDLPSLKNLRVFLKTLEKLNLAAEDVSIVVNKAESGAGIDLGDVEPLYPQGFAAVLPYSREVSRSLNLGTPVVQGNPASEISQRLIESAKKLAPPAPGVAHLWQAPAAPRRRWWKWYLKGDRN